jgi:hypothetical protein
MSENLADETRRYTHSFVLGADIVPRMSIEGFEELRDSVLEMICRIKIPKYKVTRRDKEYDDSTFEGVTKSIEDTLCSEDEIKESKFERQVSLFRKFQTELKQKNEDTYIHLCPPGTIIQLFSIKGTLRNPSGASLVETADAADANMEESKGVGRYMARWAKRRDFRRIIISPRLLLDHDPIGVKQKIQEVAREQFGLEMPFSPDNLEWVEP